jgi:hypothetical protein
VLAPVLVPEAELPWLALGLEPASVSVSPALPLA